MHLSIAATVETATPAVAAASGNRAALARSLEASASALPVTLLVMLLQSFWQAVCSVVSTVMLPLAALQALAQAARAAAPAAVVMPVQQAPPSRRAHLAHPGGGKPHMQIGLAAKSCALPLPPQSSECRGRLTVVLDLDETLLCTYRMDQLPSWLRPRLHNAATALVHYGAPSNASTTFVVLERPGLRAFLARAAAFSELVLYTAAAAQYAAPIVRHLDPDGSLFGGRLLFRDAAVGANGGGCSVPPAKDLSRLGRPLARTLLVDNSAMSFLLQPANGVPVRPYHGAGSDTQLLGVMLPLLASLAQVPDVRPVLRERFKLAAWFRAKGLTLREEVEGEAERAA